MVVVELNQTEKRNQREPKHLEFEDLVKTSISCGVCQLGTNHTVILFTVLILFEFLGVSILNAEIKQGSSFEAMKQTFVTLCTTYKIQTMPVCTGFFDVFGPDLLPAYASSKLSKYF